jgi:peptide/nickel transport system ATP-binding protein
LDVRNLRVEFPAHPRPVTAVRDLSFGVERGEVLGLVGESGSGKSVTSLAIMRLLPPQAVTVGEILFASNGAAPQNLLQVDGESMRRMRGSQISMIFQEPMTALNPVMRVGDQIAEAVRAHTNTSKKDSWDRAVEAMQEVAMDDPSRRARDYPHHLSGGMRQRVMIAMAIVNRPELLIADEPTTALDVTIQAQILDLLAELREKFGLTMLFISHDLAVVSQIADRVAVMYAGSLVELGPGAEIFRAPAHPYTRGLLKAVPTLATERDHPLQTIEGTVPPPHAIPIGCPFEPRCDFRIPQCASEFPPLIEVSVGAALQARPTGQYSEQSSEQSSAPPAHLARCPVLNPPRPL